MQLFTWKKEYSVNNTELDGHHKKLIDIINDLYSSCMEVGSSNNQNQKIEELIAYTKYHFDAEEKFMAKIGYMGIDNHIQMHKIFTERTGHLRHKDDIIEPEETKELIVILGNWILNHVLVEDKKYTVD